MWGQERHGPESHLRLYVLNRISIPMIETSTSQGDGTRRKEEGPSHYWMQAFSSNALLMEGDQGQPTLQVTFMFESAFWKCPFTFRIALSSAPPLSPRAVWILALHLWRSESSLLKEGRLEQNLQGSKWGAILCFIVSLSPSSYIEPQMSSFEREKPFPYSEAFTSVRLPTFPYAPIDSYL